MLAGDDGKETKIHLDYNGTTPMLEEVKLAIKIAMDQLWANPSSGHQQGMSV